jgi:hypothetical protein
MEVSDSQPKLVCQCPLNMTFLFCMLLKFYIFLNALFLYMHTPFVLWLTPCSAGICELHIFVHFSFTGTLDNFVVCVGNIITMNIIHYYMQIYANIIYTAVWMLIIGHWAIFLFPFLSIIVSFAYWMSFIYLYIRFGIVWQSLPRFWFCMKSKIFGQGSVYSTSDIFAQTFVYN